MKRLTYLLAVTAIWALAAASNAATVWSGPAIIVDQDTDPDILIDGVASLERGDLGLLCNALAGDVCGPNLFSNPTDFEFAFSNLNGNGDIPFGTASNYAAYIFGNLYEAVDSQPGVNLPNAGNSLGPVSGVGHIVSADVYFDFEVLLWGTGFNQTGEFAYRRSSVSNIPIPAAAWLFSSALFGLVTFARRKEQRRLL